MSTKTSYFCWKVLKSFEKIHYNLAPTTYFSSYKTCAYFPGAMCKIPSRWLSTTDCKLSEKKLFKPGFKKPLQEGETETKKKREVLERITLIATDGSMSVSTKDEADKISKRRNLKVVKVLDKDSKSQRPVYKLMKGAQYFEEDKNKKKEHVKKKQPEKVEKILTLSGKIGINDLTSKLNNATKWIDKGYVVKVVINGEEQNMVPAENVYQTMEKSLKKDAKILQKIVKGTVIRCQLMQIKKTEQTSQENKNEEVEHGESEQRGKGEG